MKISDLLFYGAVLLGCMLLSRWKYRGRVYVKGREAFYSLSCWLAFIFFCNLVFEFPSISFARSGARISNGTVFLGLCFVFFLVNFIRLERMGRRKEANSLPVDK